MKRKVSNPLALAVLALLLERSTHPYDMGRTMRERHKEESIKLNYGSLYTVLEQLLRAGFVRKRETRRETARPERTIYEITPAGRVELHDWMAELVSTPVKEFRDFEAALALLGVLVPEEAVRLLQLRRERLEAQIAERDFVDRLVPTLEDPQLMEMWRSFHRQSAEEREKGRKE